VIDQLHASAALSLSHSLARGLNGPHIQYEHDGGEKTRCLEANPDGPSS
jgi:hypothetical protein